MVKLFDLCYSEYAWDSLSKWFIVQFYFTKTIATMQKSNGGWYRWYLWCYARTLLETQSVDCG
ncbi:hypothetical protein [Streptococcus pneumoniae]|uniref:hypothetical protein n=1 Tax=Streptococcus pneumoniae TaxID=1313 RepID=UPI00099124D0|nr:hypothetical protein [Streptococcus pneumoniae]